MTNKIRFGAFVREAAIQQTQIRFSELTPEVKEAARGKEKIKLRRIDAWRLIQPYVSSRFMEQFRAVVPLAVYLALFQIFILRQDVSDAWIITGGLVAVILGLMLFMEGLKVGLMPFGELLGSTLPTRSPLYVVLIIAFLLGIGVTFAEPAIGALKAAGQIVDVNRAPYLYALLNYWPDTLVLVVGVGVGMAAVLGTIRFIYSWSLKPLIYITLVPVLGLTFFMALDPQLAPTLGLAWDSGAVTTGPVTVPLVLSLGIGIAASAGKGESSLSGFGIVTLASLFPILVVELLAVYVSFNQTPEEIIQLATQAATAATQPGWMEMSPGAEIIGGIRAIVPLVLFLLIVLVFIAKEKPSHPNITAYGISLCVLGMIVFNLGLTFGLSKLGEQSGSVVPAAFTILDLVKDSPLYSIFVGLFIAIGFAWFLGFGATLAEPALNALGLTVENLTNGAFRKSILMYAVSFGVGCGIALGVARMIYDWPLIWLVLPGYLIAIVFTWLSTEEFVNIAWDSAGVTTGPVTVPLVLALGLGFGNAVEALHGFGILAMASIGPILSVLATGLWIRWKMYRRDLKRNKLPEIQATVTT
ncbi:MAG: DUF1538 domain-containing protein [Gammaproteobacteria bacterium]|nr:MAG: DUF1538 domain-containing protein [Gammaproteobacteria bacterium]